MELSERKKNILEVIIRDYIDTAEPVGSRTISKKYQLGISPATIRNEMADLEDLGYLAQPHTSSGRIPTNKAYRYYVDEIMKIQKLEKLLRNDIQKGYLEYSKELANTMSHTASLISKLTNYAAVVLSPKVTWFNCKHVQIIPLLKNRVLMVIVTREGIAKNSDLILSQELDINTALKLSNAINNILRSVSINEVTVDVIKSLGGLTSSEKALLSEIMPKLQDILIEQNAEVYSTGLTNLLDYPEFSEVEKIRQLVNAVERKSLLAEVLIDKNESNLLYIRIGDENEDKEFKELSVITTSYEFEGNIIGAFGVIGPTRMNYDKVSSILEFLREELNSNIIKMLKL